MVDVSVVIPVFNGEQTVDELARRLVETLEACVSTFEVICVDDASSDSSWERIESLATEDSRIRGIRFPRNFGQHYAMSAGLEAAVGEWVVTMDCDLQDVPEVIPDLLAEARTSGVEIVYARSVPAAAGVWESVSSRLFYRFFSWLTGARMTPAIGSFRLMSRVVVDVFNQMPERRRFFGGMIDWMGFSDSSVDIARSHREAGETGYTFRKRIQLAADAVIAFSDRPLLLTLRIGTVTCLLSMAYGFFIVVQRLRGEIPEIGFATLTAAIMFLSGVLMLSVGMVGLYVSRVFEQVKGRPYYIVDRRTDEG